MKTNIQKYNDELDKLYFKGLQLRLGMLEDLDLLKNVVYADEELKKLKPLSFINNYEGWYSEALYLIKQILPERLEDFKTIYKNEKRKEIDYLNYTISDYLINLTVTRGATTKVNSSAAVPKFQIQLNILHSAKNRFSSSLFDIKQLLQSDIFDNEIDTCRELLKKGFLRAAGAIAGVIIEKHLRLVLDNRNIKITKKYPGIADLNELLKNNNIIDVPQWRHIQLMADIRNICDHNKERDPKKEEIIDLLDGTNKILKSIY